MRDYTIIFIDPNILLTALLNLDPYNSSIFIKELQKLNKEALYVQNEEYLSIIHKKKKNY